MSDKADREELIFEEALKRATEAGRAAFLDEACAGDAGLRARMDLLLEGYSRAQGFLTAEPERKPQVAGPSMPTVRIVSEGPGTIVGRYKLLQQIGEGGMGVVFMAEQREPVVRKVALKIIKLGMDTRQVIARFEAERQALALMDHPNIARVLDGGETENGRPYFVMDLVQGLPIGQFCDEAKLSIGDRLKLFLDVCSAIQHAHQKGIIHRDIKPSNILVTLHGDKPVPKVIDFGVAKATQQPLTEKTLFTQFQHFIGTPAYMSPEQASLSGLDIDTRSDIYALGVVLYELLTGTTPCDAKELLKSGLEEMRRIIRETEPVKPSTRVARERAAAKSEIRNPESEIDADLDWIVMKCLEKDRARRYESAGALAADLKRHLGHEPVAARPPSAAYRFRRLVRRNRLAFAAGASVAAALVIGLTLSSWMFLREKDARWKAQTESARREQVAQFLNTMLAHVGPKIALGQDTKLLREILDETVARLNEITNHPAVEADLRTTLGNVYLDLADYTNAAAMHTQALAIRKRIHDEEHEEVACSLTQLGLTLEGQAKYEQALALLEQALAIRRKLHGSEHAAVAACLDNLGIPLWRLGRLEESEKTIRQALTMREKLLGKDHLSTANSLHNLATVLNAQDKPAEAEALYARALDIQRRLLPRGHPDAARTVNNLAISFQNQRKWKEAEELHRETLESQSKILGERHPGLAVSLNNLANSLKAQGNLAEAELRYSQSLQLLKSLFGETHPDVPRVAFNLGNVLARQRKFEAAEATYRDALSTIVSLLGRQHPDAIQCMGGLAHVFTEQDRFAEALPILQEALDLSRRSSFTIDRGEILDSLANTLTRLGRYPEAELLYQELIDLRRATKGDIRSPTASRARLLTDWAWAQYQARGRFPSTAATHDPALADASEASSGANRPPTEIAGAPLDLAREAESILRESLAYSVARSTNASQRFRVADYSSRLGGAVLAVAMIDDSLDAGTRREKLADAEKLLTDGYTGLRQQAEDGLISNRKYLRDAVDRLARFYEATGSPQQGAEWKQQLAELEIPEVSAANQEGF